MPLLQSDDVKADPAPENQEPYVIRTGGARLRRFAYGLLGISLIEAVGVFLIHQSTGTLNQTWASSSLLMFVVALYFLIVRPDAGWRFDNNAIDYRARSVFGGRIARVEARDIAEVIVRPGLLGFLVGYRLGFRLKNGKKMMLAESYKPPRLRQMMHQAAKRLPTLSWPEVR